MGKVQHEEKRQRCTQKKKKKKRFTRDKDNVFGTVKLSSEYVNNEQITSKYDELALST